MRRRADRGPKRARAEATLAAVPPRPSLENHEILRSFVEEIDEAIYITTPDGAIVDGNPALLRIFGAKALEELQKHRAQDLFVDPSRRDEEKALLDERGSVRAFVFDIRRLDGEIRTVRDAVYARRDEDGDVIAYHGILVDITQRRQDEVALRESEEKYRAIFENVQDVFYQTNLDGQILEISPSVARYLSYERTDLIGESIHRLYKRREEWLALTEKLLAEGEVNDYEVEMKSRAGEVLTVSVNARAVHDEKGDPTGYEGLIRDISLRKELERKLAELSVRDPLTGCYNRRFLETMQARLERPTARWGCLVLDLDNFKSVNDAYGHEEGDRVLQGVSHFVRRHGRAEDVLVRLGGDEFAMIVQASSREELDSIAQRLLDVSPQESPAAFSLGVAYRRPGENLDQVLARADRAMYAAKGRGLIPPTSR